MTLPTYDELVKLYREGFTFAELAQEFEAPKSTLYNALRQGAYERGEWPLCNEQERRNRIRRARTGHCQLDMVDSSSTVIRLQVRLQEYDGTCSKFCREHDLRPTTISELLRGRKPKITRQLADRLESVLDR